MTIRTTEYEVRQAIETEEDVDVSQYILTASIVVDRIEARAAELGIAGLEPTLVTIETYLASHFYALRYPQYIQKTVGPSSGLQQGKTDMAFDSTLWGQMAKALDPTGILSQANDGVYILEGYWLGKELDATN